jgi:hypothetical protein
MAKLAWRRRLQRDESGAILPTAAIMLVALSAFAALALAGGSVYAAAQDGRKAADFAALAGAANMPTVNLGTTQFDPTNNPLSLPIPSQADTPLGTLDLTGSLPTLNNNWTTGVCAVAAREFGGNRSPVDDNYPAGPTSCTTTFGFENQWLQDLANCLAGTTAAADCANRYITNLSQSLTPPSATDPAVAALQNAITTAGQTGQVVTQQFLAQVQSLNTTLGGALTPLLQYFNANGGINVNFTQLAPALLTPSITVGIRQFINVPGANLLRHGPVTVTSTATARRAIKNAVVLPTVKVQPDGTFTFNPNSLLDKAMTPAFNALSKLGSDISPHADQAMQTVVCPVLTTPCPSVGASFDSALSDVQDAIMPPNGPTPSEWALIQWAEANGQPIMLSYASLLTDPKQILGSTVYSLPGVSSLLGQFDYIPAMGMVPVILSAGPLGQVIATPVNTAVAAGRTQGLYRARLVD